MYTIVETILRPILMFVYRVRITGREHVPESGPCVLAANHVSVMDGFFLGISVTRQVRFMAKAELYRRADRQADPRRRRARSRSSAARTRAGQSPPG